MSDENKEPTPEEIERERLITAFKQHVAESQAIRFGSFKEIIEHKIASLERHLGIKLSEDKKEAMRKEAACIDSLHPPFDPKTGNHGLLRVRPRPKSGT